MDAFLLVVDDVDDSLFAFCCKRTVSNDRFDANAQPLRIIESIPSSMAARSSSVKSSWNHLAVSAERPADLFFLRASDRISSTLIAGGELLSASSFAALPLATLSSMAVLVVAVVVTVDDVSPWLSIHDYDIMVD